MRGFGGDDFAGEREFKARGGDHQAKVLIDLEDAYRGATRSITLRAVELGEDGRPHMRERTLNVKIPKGVRQGQQIRLAGQGEPGIGGGPAGDLYLEIEFNPHSIYRVEGRRCVSRSASRPLGSSTGPQGAARRRLMARSI